MIKGEHVTTAQCAPYLLPLLVISVRSTRPVAFGVNSKRSIQNVFDWDPNPAIRDACDSSISGHAAQVEADIAEAMKLYRLRAKWTAKSFALHTQAVLQGAFILAKAKGGAEIAAASIDQPASVHRAFV